MNKHIATDIAAAVVISLALLGWYALVGYVVTITGSTDGLPETPARPRASSAGYSASGPADSVISGSRTYIRTAT